MVDSPHEHKEVDDSPTIFAIIHGDVDHDMDGQLWFLEKSGESVVLPSLDMFRKVFEKKGKLQQLKDKRSPTVLIERETGMLERAENALKEELGEDLYKKIFACQHMVFLIDSMGGQMVGGNAFMSLAKMVRENNGTVQSYVGNFAQSAAADVLSETNSRHALPGTRFMWHARLGENVKEEHIAEDEQRIRDFFGKTVRREQEIIQGKLHATLTDTQNTGKRVDFTGSELEKHGILTTADDLSTLRSTLERENPLMASASKEFRRRIGKFFLYNRIESAIQKELGVSVHFRPETSGPVVEYNTKEMVSNEVKRKVGLIIQRELQRI